MSVPIEVPLAGGNATPIANRNKAKSATIEGTNQVIERKWEIGDAEAGGAFLTARRGGGFPSNAGTATVTVHPAIRAMSSVREMRCLEYRL